MTSKGSRMYGNGKFHSESLKQKEPESEYTNKIITRLAGMNDLDQVYDCYKEICLNQRFEKYTPLWEIDVYPARSDMRKYIENKGLLIAADPEKNKVVAVMCLLKEPDWASIHLFGIRPDYRKTGLSKVMLQEAESWASQNGKQEIQLDVIQSNLPARKLYEHYGYQFIKDFDDKAEKDYFMHFSLYHKNIG